MVEVHYLPHHLVGTIIWCLRRLVGGDRFVRFVASVFLGGCSSSSNILSFTCTYAAWCNLYGGAGSGARPAGRRNQRDADRQRGAGHGDRDEHPARPAGAVQVLGVAETQDRGLLVQPPSEGGTLLPDHRLRKGGGGV